QNVLLNAQQHRSRGAFIQLERCQTVLKGKAQADSLQFLAFLEVAELFFEIFFLDGSFGELTSKLLAAGFDRGTKAAVHQKNGTRSRFQSRMLYDGLVQLLEELAERGILLERVAGKNQHHRMQAEFAYRRMKTPKMLARDHPRLERPGNGSRRRRLQLFVVVAPGERDRDEDNENDDDSVHNHFPDSSETGSAA